MWDSGFKQSYNMKFAGYSISIKSDGKTTEVFFGTLVDNSVNESQMKFVLDSLDTQGIKVIMITSKLSSQNSGGSSF